MSVCAKFQLSSWSRSCWKVCGGGVVGWCGWCGGHVTTMSNSNASCFRFELSWVALGFDNLTHSLDCLLISCIREVRTLFRHWRRKLAILFCRFHHENSIPRKNGVHHEKANGKSNKTVDSDFSFSKFCHRDFSPQSSILLKKNDLRFWRSLKKPSLLLNDATDVHYQYVKIKMIKARTFWYIW